jgi:hypothetical protein
MKSNLFNSGLAFLIIAVALWIGSAPLRAGSIYFFTDIARDFLLLDDVVRNGLTLIGPRASGMEGLFHGPLWLYINLPAFLLGNYNPLVVGWFWVCLAAVSLFSNFFILKKIVGTRIALLHTTLFSLFIAHHLYSFYNPFGAVLLVPFYVYLLYFYICSKQAKYLALHFFLAGCLIQFQMAVGVPLAMLSVLITTLTVLRSKKLSHLAVMLVVIIPLLTFLLFELRHGFTQLQAALNFLQNKTDVAYFSHWDRLLQRFSLAVHDSFRLTEVSEHSRFNAIALMIVAFAFGRLNQLSEKTRSLFLLSTGFILGFYVLSLVFNGMLLVHYWIVLVPLSLLILSIAISSVKGFFGYVVSGIVILISVYSLIVTSRLQTSNVSLIEDDWMFQTQIAETIFQDASDKSFGYFIFTPDIYAYESKFVMKYYELKKYPQTAVSIYEKRPLTYIIVAPVPKERPDILASEWKKVRVGLKRDPDEVFTLPAGYTIEKYFLSPDEVQLPTDPNINDWIHFR